AEIAIKKHAARACLAQDPRVVLRIDNRVFLENLLGRHVQVSGKRVNIFLRDIHAGLSAAVSARLAIDLLLYLASNPAKEILGIVVRFEKSPKADILSLFHLREPTDLDEVGDHASSIPLPPARWFGGRLLGVKPTEAQYIEVAIARSTWTPSHP